MNDLHKLVQVNKRLKEEKLVISTWGNASCRFDDNNIYIKPSGVPFSDLTEEKLSKIDLKTEIHLSGLKPSVDTPTHLILYKAFPEVKAIIHTHSKYCTIFAQAKISIPCMGTTHADYFYGEVPVVRDLSPQEIEHEYERNTGLKIVEYFKEKNISPREMPAALSPSHGVFVWGDSLDNALKTAVVLENIAEMAYKTINLCYNKLVEFDENLLNKHFLRKHGSQKYYGQK